MKISKNTPRIIFLLLILLPGLAQYLNAYEMEQLLKQLSFEKITIETGLSQNNVFAIIQDRQGFMWFGTEDGLNCYDGYNCKIYQNIYGDETSLSDNKILSLFEDHDGYLWVGTKFGGLNRFDPLTDQFTHYKYNPEDSNSLSSNQFITAIVEDSNDYLWVGTESGLNCIDPSRKKIERLPLINWTQESLNADFIWSLFIDEDGFIWVGSNHGVRKIDPNTKEVTHFNDRPGNHYYIPNTMIRSVYKDLRDTLWISSIDGLIIYDLAAKSFRKLQHDPADPHSLINNQLRFIMPDRKSDRIWIGTKGGLELFNRSTGEFLHFRKDDSRLTSLGQNFVYCLYQDSLDNLWIGTIGGGVNKVNRKKEKFLQYVPNPHFEGGLNDKDVLALYQDNQNYLWLGTSAGGLNRLNRATGEYTYFLQDDYNLNMFKQNEIKAIVDDGAGHLFLGSKQNGLIIFNTQDFSYQYIRYTDSNLNLGRANEIWSLYHDGSALWIGQVGGIKKFNYESEKSEFFEIKIVDNLRNSIYLTSIAEDDDHYLWVGTYGGGLLKFDKKKGWVKRFLNTTNSANSISNNRVISVLADGKYLWVGTLGGGLNRLDRETERFEIWRANEGLPSNDVVGILKDPAGYLWLSTNNGLSCFDPNRGVFRNYSMTDGLQSYQFSDDACFMAPTGEMLFGSDNGFISFFSDSVQDNLHIPPIVITGFRKFDKEMQFERPISKMEQIGLSYQDNYFSIQFSALDYMHSAKNHYAYWLEGFDKDWIYCGTRHEASYTNLDGGTYIFHVIGSNNDGVWNQAGTSLKIVIKPPFWETIWFRLGVGLLLASVLWTGYRFRIQTIEKQKKRLELLVGERTCELDHRNQELVQINKIVKSINMELDFRNLLQSILDELSDFGCIEKASALIYDREKKVYCFVASSGWKIDDLESIKLTEKEAEMRYIQNAENINQCIFYIENIVSRPASEKFSHLPLPKAMLVMKMIVQNHTDGYLIFENMRDTQAFRTSELKLFQDLYEHLLAVFIKSLILEELKALNEKKNSFLGMAAHDLRNPLSGIKGFIQLFITSLKFDQFDKMKGIQDLERVLRVVDRMSSLINNLLDISAIESGKVLLKKSWVNYCELIEENISLYSRIAQQKDIELLYEPDSSIPHLSIDRVRIGEVLDNLLSNAIKYTFPGGTVNVSLNFNGKEVITSVKDNGQGLLEEDLDHIFKSYKKLSAMPTGGETSTGLGLAIARKIIELHGGAIHVKSIKGEGSTFWFSLPFSNKVD